MRFSLILSKPILIALVAIFLVQGCAGYTTKTDLPDHVKTVHVEKVINSIDITGEITNKESYRTYRPGLEVEVRNALIETFIFDGHLKISDLDRADAILKAELLEFRRDPLRYTDSREIQEYRVNVVVAAKFVDLQTEQVLWATRGISGNSTYFLSGELATTEDEAVRDALEDLSRHIIEDVLEVW